MNSYLSKLIKENKLPIVIDYDGVLFEARWYKERINMPNETEEKLIAAHKRGECLNTKVISFMQNIIRENKDNKYYVLSHMHSNEEFEFKKKQIKKYYPEIPIENVLYATSVENKIDYLKKIKEQYGAFIYIDDTHPSLIMFENYFDTDCKFFHVSSLYV